MSSYELTEINNFETSTTYNSITVTPEITPGSGAVEKYYYGIEETDETMAYVNSDSSVARLSNTYAALEDVEFIESDEASYTFSNLQPNSSYTVYSYTIDENDIKSNVYQTNITTVEYENPTIDNVTHSVTLDSITVNVTASGGSNSISKYKYKIDESDWVESDSSSYTFNNLTDTTEYEIRIKVVDSEGVESTEYYEAITTEVYILPVVSSVTSSTTWNSITLTPSGTDGTNTIDHYEYSINDGAYQTSNVFSNLTENTSYNIKVKAIDTAGRESNVYEMNVTTDAYKLPTISVSTSATSNSITINVNATPGDGDIVSYHYSRDNGSNYQISSNNTYTFNGLTSETTFYIKVYVTDSNGRRSNIYTTNVTTEANTLANYIINNVYEEDGVNGLYYHDGLGTYSNANQEAGDNSYRFAGGDYQLTSKAISAGYTTVSMNTIFSPPPSVINLYCNGNKILIGFVCNSSHTRYYTTAYDETMQFNTYEEALNSAVNDGYLTKDNIKNFVCFGTNTTSCPAENLYRIIGIFEGQIKLIKWDYATTTMLGTDGDYATIQSGNNYSSDTGYLGKLDSYPWYFWNRANYNIAYNATGYYNVWNYSALNTVNLNKNYINYLESGLI